VYADRKQAGQQVTGRGLARMLPMPTERYEGGHDFGAGKECNNFGCSLTRKKWDDSAQKPVCPTRLKLTPGGEAPMDTDQDWLPPRNKPPVGASAATFRPRRGRQS
jgi:hypothetical protein